MTTFGTSQARILLERHSSWTIGQTVSTRSGPVRGHPASKASEVSVYLGMPYAQPPIDDLRFAPRQKYSGNTIIDGTNFVSRLYHPSSSQSERRIGIFLSVHQPIRRRCPANTTGKNLTAVGDAALNSLLEVVVVSNEGCLTLNIWTKPQVGEQQKAVMVWIYGGGFQQGRSSDLNYDGQFIGGDPTRITLFGQSAGAGSIDFYSYAYTSDPIVSGLILESGTTSLGTFTPEETAASWYNVTTALGYGNATSNQNAFIHCMRSKDW
jgi:cholinesterase